MILKIKLSTIKAVMRPYQIDLGDILGIQPKLTIGALNACSLNTVHNKTLVITNGIIMMYNKLEDFLAGLEPLSLVKDETIQYNQEAGMIDFFILDDTEVSYDNAEFAEVRELMFGARVENDEVSEDVS